MFKTGKYKTIVSNVTIFRSRYETAVISKKGTTVEIVEVEEEPKGKVRGYLKDGSYIIMQSLTGVVTVEPVKAAKKGGTK